MSAKPTTVEEWMRREGRSPYGTQSSIWRDGSTPGEWAGCVHLLPSHIFDALQGGDYRDAMAGRTREYASRDAAIADLEQALIAVQPDVHVNAAGGKQSAIPTRFDLMPPDALIQVAKVLARGVHYGADNWRLIPKRDHLNHALLHLAMHLKGDTSETHLANAACRLLFAIEAPYEVPNG